MGINRILVSTAFAALFVGSTAIAAENDKTAGSASVTNATDAKPLVASDGVWVGVIEDIQHIKDGDGFKLAEGARFADEMVMLFNESPIASWSYWLFRHNVSIREPRFYLVTLKGTNNNLEKFVIHEVLQWNVGDKIEITKNGNSVSVKTLELGEISRYAAEKAAERGEK